MQEGQDPLAVAAEQLTRDGVHVLHTIGGDDTNTAAADLAAYLATQGSELTVVGLPKTIDNDIVPIRQSLGAQTAAQQASRFAQNVLAEHGSNPRMLIVHEVMGRASGWLTAAAARDYMAWHAEQEWLPGIGLDGRKWAIHAVYVPERHIDLAAEATRLRAVMDEIGCVNIFLAEGAGIDDIVAALEAAGEEVGRDPFGHVKLDTINPGRWFAQQFAERMRALGVARGDRVVVVWLTRGEMTEAFGPLPASEVAARREALRRWSALHRFAFRQSYAASVPLRETRFRRCPRG